MLLLLPSSLELAGHEIVQRNLFLPIGWGKGMSEKETFHKIFYKQGNFLLHAVNIFVEWRETEFEGRK